MSREYMRQWRKDNPKKHSERNCAYAKKKRLKDPEGCRKIGRIRNKKWYHANIEKAREYHRNRMAKLRASDVKHRIIHSLRERVRQAIKGESKSRHTMQLLSCPMWSFKIYLESRFDVGMSWENYGKVWEIDHIIPCALFDLSKPDHQRRCFHFSNLQPMFVELNRSKGKKFIAP